MTRVHSIDHPLVSHHLTTLRNRETPSELFRSAANRLAFLAAFEATKDLQVQPVSIETPLTRMQAQRLSQRIGLIPILRAGLGLVEPILHLIPEAEVWHLGLFRDEETLEPVEYYQKLPPNRPVDVAFVTDPMLATGGSALAALETLEHWGVNQTRLVALIAAPEGIAAVQARFPDTPITVCAIDEKLNEQAYIMPGLGDAGDRIFNTLRR